MGERTGESGRERADGREQTGESGWEREWTGKWGRQVIQAKRGEGERGRTGERE